MRRVLAGKDASRALGIKVKTDINSKYERLRSGLRAYAQKGLAVGYSGGADSSLLIAVAHDVLGDRMIAVTAQSPLYSEYERDEAVRLARRLGVRHVVIDSDELATPGFAENPPDRCYLCKRALFREIAQAGRAEGLEWVADGTNADDLDDYRPGRRAAREAGVVSPLLEAGLTKAEIHALSRRLALPTAGKPAMACLASRFPYGTRITEDALNAVGMVETTLRRHGVRCYRVRFHDTLCRIELGTDELSAFIGSPACEAAVAAAQKAGFTYVALDLEGYRTGSMNETLDPAVGREPL